MQRIQQQTWLPALMMTMAIAGGCDPEQYEPAAEDAVQSRETAETHGVDDISVVDDAAEHAGLPDDFQEISLPAATLSGWTAWTSEETPPVGCDPGSLVNQFGCSGRYCDNVRLHCAPTGAASGGSYWTSYFSEEGTDYRVCGAGYWMSAIGCKGRYCDNVSLQCTSYPSLTPKNCYWTGWISEEGGGTLWYGYSYYARGAQCDGSYCDNKRFFVCRI